MIHIGDDTDAFDFSFLTIYLKNADQYTITKAEVRIGPIKKVFDSPTFPLQVALNKKETDQLNEYNNKCYMAVYDTQNRKYTCKGTLSFKAEPKVV